jgi:hypothetical protein
VLLIALIGKVWQLGIKHRQALAAESLQTDRCRAGRALPPTAFLVALGNFAEFVYECVKSVHELCNPFHVQPSKNCTQGRVGGEKTESKGRQFAHPGARQSGSSFHSESSSKTTKQYTSRTQFAFGLALNLTAEALASSSSFDNTTQL